jgi:hypothetical protein
VIDPPEALPEAQTPNIATIAILGLMAGLVLWLGGACLLLGGGGQGLPDPGTLQQQQRSISTPKAAQASPTSPTRLPDRTSCADIRGTDYRSDSERQWFLANCR